VDSEDGNL
jgi:hypothetical protein